MAFYITITRTDDWTESYSVWAKRGAIPLEEGDGIFVANYPIAPDETGVSEEWTPPWTGDTGILVIPIRGRIAGPGSGYIQ